MPKEHRKNISQDADWDIRLKDLMIVRNENVRSFHVPKDSDYTKILSEIGIKKPEGEPLTEEDLYWIYLYMQEGLLTGS